MKEKIPEFFYVEIYLTNKEHLKIIINELSPENIKRSKQKEDKWIAEAYIEQKKIKWLEEYKYSFKIIENATKKGLERQKEVSKENRYEKPNTLPKGLGRKIK